MIGECGMRGGIGVAFIAAALIMLFCLGEASLAASRSVAPRSSRATGLLMSGFIGPGSYREFRRAVRRGTPDMIVLQGPGGVLEEAMLIAEEVHRRGIPTAVSRNAHCASACAIIFFAGRSKYMAPGAKVGLHSAGFIDGRTHPDGTNVMAAYLARLGVPALTLRRMAMTAPNHIRWITQAERSAIGIKALKIDPH